MSKTCIIYPGFHQKRNGGPGFFPTFQCNNDAINGAISGVKRDELEVKKIILSEIEVDANFSTRQLSETLNMSFRSVQRYISNLREKGFIGRVGANKNGY